MSELIERLRVTECDGYYCADHCTKLFTESADALEAKDQRIERLEAVVDAAKYAVKHSDYFPAMQGLREALAALHGEQKRRAVPETETGKVIADVKDRQRREKGNE